MRIYEIDRQTARAIVEYGSRGFQLAPLARSTSAARTDVAFLAAGGRIGRHPAAGAQLLLVIAGHGQVSGADNRPVAIGAGQAVFWEPGELHEIRAVDDLVAVIVEADELAISAAPHPD